jgi:hypothetical protein
MFSHRSAHGYEQLAGHRCVDGAGDAVDQLNNRFITLGRCDLGSENNSYCEFTTQGGNLREVK